jgi:hypothetical protein
MLSPLLLELFCTVITPYEESETRIFARNATAQWLEKLPSRTLLPRLSASRRPCLGRLGQLRHLRVRSAQSVIGMGAALEFKAVYGGLARLSPSLEILGASRLR